MFEMQTESSKQSSYSTVGTSCHLHPTLLSCTMFSLPVLIILFQRNPKSRDNTLHVGVVHHVFFLDLISPDFPSEVTGFSRILFGCDFNNMSVHARTANLYASLKET